MPRAHTRAADPAAARVRGEAARAYLLLAEASSDDEDPAIASAAAGIAVLAGIAASDAICAVRLGCIHRGDDHRAAADLLATATPDGKRLAATFRRLIDLKDEAHYGTGLLSTRKAQDAVKWARTLVDRSREELER